MRQDSATFALVLIAFLLFFDLATAQETASSAQLKSYSCETRHDIADLAEKIYGFPEDLKTSKRNWLINASSAANAVTAAQSLAFLEGRKQQKGKSPAEYITNCTAIEVTPPTKH